MGEHVSEVIIPAVMPPELRGPIAQRALSQSGPIAADIYAMVVASGRAVDPEVAKRRKVSAEAMEWADKEISAHPDWTASEHSAVTFEDFKDRAKMAVRIAELESELAELKAVAAPSKEKGVAK